MLLNRLPNYIYTITATDAKTVITTEREEARATRRKLVDAGFSDVKMYRRSLTNPVQTH